ncbi:MAG: class I SAM-dependent methyltransferase [Deltaproteobacteria bacterium]|jgi:bifunctional enzyme CysN/CysC|nr:class I SAM-dependent methyltransferase [Deltaproteobacteria bacterium]MBT4266858.1 class I SAM-dependent methyltransferase [Deltaproteobacteria bacterium]MBT4640827.1 class I SAM-dependent methyltransferase [Deltaproteobacteria bacterium]MBT6502348.1 class I SAM-dependent methyltransferase [Deltaproteobacteria bacterium]MBT7155847.1 class I SAM-dependent methyltransferase [Deltaproteobacteria bacterium]
MSHPKKTNVAQVSVIKKVSHVSLFATSLVSEGYLKEGHKVLSLASGIGIDEAYFAEQAKADVLGTDIEDELLSEAKIKEGPRLRYMIVDVTKPFEFSQSFDVVYARNLLHYFNGIEQQRVVESIRDVLLPGGYFFFQLKSKDDYLYTNPDIKKIQQSDGLTFFPDVGFSRNHLSQEEVRRLLRKNGFGILRLETSQETLYNDTHPSNLISVIAQKGEL